MLSYLKLLADIRSNGEGHDDRTGVGTTSVFGRQWRHSMADGFPLLTTKRVSFRWVAEELFWFLSGSTDVKDLQARGVDIWDEWATKEQCERFGREEGDLGPVYGRLWRFFPGCGTDQIKQACDALRNFSNSRRIIVSGWHPAEQANVALPPCHTLFQLKIHPQVTRRCVSGGANIWEEKSGPGLSLHLYARSIDSFLGLPFNIASYALLLQLLSHTHNLIPCDLIISFGDLHIYNNHREQVSLQLSREPRALPVVCLSERLAGAGFEGLLSAEWSDIRLHRYNPHPKIAADVAV